ncbi:MAG: protein kinase [Anaerolineae bacterium]
MSKSTPSTHREQSLSGTRLGKYQVHAEIGRGGMGTVYKAYDPTLDRFVALKVLAPHLAWEEEFVERFLREARSAARLKHPNIVTIYDVGRAGGWYYFAMDHVEGQTLADRIQQHGPMSLREVLAILRPLANALDYAHKRGLVHRDVKPANVIVGSGGQPTLTDFGIARAAAETRLTRTGAIVGTPEYLSPEQARGEAVVPATDQYSLGVVAYEMLSGKAPFKAESTPALLYKVVHERPPSLRGERPDLSEAVEEVLERALAKEPTQRHSSCQAFVDALGRAVPAPASSLSTPTQAEPAAFPRRAGVTGRPLWIGVGLAGILMIALCVGVASVATGRFPLFPDRENGVTPTVESVTEPPTVTVEPTDAPTLTATKLPPTNTPVPPTRTPSRVEREGALLRAVRYRPTNGEVIFAYPAEAPPAIDGELREWEGPYYDVPYTVHDPEAAWYGRSDLSGRFAVRWDAQNLYLGVEVTDDVHVQVRTGEGIWEGDDVEIQIDADLAADFSDVQLSSDDGQIGFSAGDFASLRPEAYIWRPADREQAGEMIDLAVQQTVGGYILEAAVPWWVLGGRPSLEAPVGFCLSLGDNDSPGMAQQQTMVATAPGRKWGDPTTWGTLIVVDWR